MSYIVKCKTKIIMSKKALIWTLPLVLILLSWSTPYVDKTILAEEIAATNQLIELVNHHRLDIGKPQLIRNATADKLAAEHTSYMISNKDVNNDNFEVRLETLEQKENATEISENVGIDLTAEDTMNAYLNNIWLKVNAEGDFTHTGIAVKKGENGKFYYTQIFYN